jgi:hypothetical protein
MVSRFAALDQGSSITTLDDYLAASSRIPWRWGVMDCCQFGGGWVRSRLGRDPLVAFSYKSLRDVHRIVAENGGLIPIIDRGMAAIGCGRTTEPDFGDVGALEVLGTQRITGYSVGIFDGLYWITKEFDGLFYSKPESVIAWRVG